MCVCRFKCYSLICTSCKLADSEHSALESSLCINKLCTLLCCSLWSVSRVCVVLVEVVLENVTMRLTIISWHEFHKYCWHMWLCLDFLCASLCLLQSYNPPPGTCHCPCSSSGGQAVESICQVGTWWERFPRCLDGGWFALACNIPQFIILKCS